MKVRSLHFDMKGMIPKAEYMQSLCKDIASFGFTHLLVEFEDKFPFRNYGFMHHPAAYSKRELSALDSPELRVIPLLQSAGHLDYLLKYPHMKMFRKEESIYQWNMTLPKVFDIWREMADEILEVYPDCEYFHIGADEADICSQDDFNTYVQHVEHCVDYLAGKGKKVIIWDDMFRKQDLTALQRLLHKVIVQVWQYRTVDENLIRNMVDTGVEVWGASRIQDCYLYRGMGAQTAMRENVNDWTLLNAKYELQGHTGTIWGRIHSTTPLCASLPQSMYMIMYLGKSLTGGRIPDLNEFHRQLSEWFGDQNLNVAGLAAKFRYEPEQAARFLHPVPKHNDILEIMTVMNELDCLFAYADDCMSANNAMLGLYRTGGAPPKTTNNYLDGVRIIRERTTALKKRIDDVIGIYFPESILNEFKHERFDAILELNDRQEKEILAGAFAFKRTH